MEKNHNRLLVISLDAVGAADAGYFSELPNFKKFLEKASWCFNVSSIYPSLTYPAHTSIVTGCYPKKHGIINNTRFQPGRLSPDWFWQRKYVKVPTFYDKALEAGMTVAALLWPVTARSGITWNMPEIFANRPWSNQIFTSLKNGSPMYQAVIQKKFGGLRKGKCQPQLDDFTTAALKHTLEKHQPDVTLVHWTDVDTQRHIYGVSSPEAQEALKRHDDRLGQVFEVLENQDLMEQTNIILLGDHYQKETSRVIFMNYYFAGKGWLTVKDGKITGWQVYSKNCDGSAYVYIRRGCGHLKDEVYEFLKSLEADGSSGIEQVIGGRDAAAMGADPHCSFMLEAADGYYFQDGCDRESADVDVVEPSDAESSDGYEAMKGTHGYLPGKPGYQTVFMAAGPDIRENVNIPAMCLVDEGPTMARLLGLELPEVDGRVLESILK